MADAEIIQLGSRGRAGRGSRSSPSEAARGLAGTPRPRTPTSTSAPRPRPAPEPGPGPVGDDPAESVPAESVPAESVLTDHHPTGGREGADHATDDREFRDRDRHDHPIHDHEADDQEADDQEDDDHDSVADEAGSATDDDSPRSSTFAQPAFDLAALVGELAAALGSVLDQLKGVEVDQLRGLAADPLATALELLGRLGVDLGEPAERLAEFARSRFRGDYAVDEFGFDPEFTERVFLPLLRPLVHNWFRVDVRGAENLPEHGSALLVSNHAGTMPLDGMVLHAVVHEEIGRHVRMLGADLIFATPYSHDLARKTGTTLACAEDTERLLASDQLVAVFPEGFKGLGKLYADRYKLQRFGRGGFVSAAVRAQVPIVPVSIVGSEEIYPLLSRAPSLARALGVPYFPITPLFPWFGLLGMVPLPSKWVISFGEAIATDELPAGAAEDPMVVFNVTDQVRETIQQTLYAQLVARRSAFR